MMVAGGRGAGKTTFTKHLKERDWLVHPTPQRIPWCYAKHQTEFVGRTDGICSSSRVCTRYTTGNR